MELTKGLPIEISNKIDQRAEKLFNEKGFLTIIDVKRILCEEIGAPVEKDYSFQSLQEAMHVMLND